MIGYIENSMIWLALDSMIWLALENFKESTTLKIKTKIPGNNEWL